MSQSSNLSDDDRAAAARFVSDFVDRNASLDEEDRTPLGPAGAWLVCNALVDALARIDELERMTGVNLAGVGLDHLVREADGKTWAQEPHCFLCQATEFQDGELVVLCAPCALKS